MKKALTAFALTAASLVATAAPSFAQYYNYGYTSYGSGGSRTYTGSVNGTPFSGQTYTSPSGRWGSYSGFSGGKSYGGNCWNLGSSVSCSGY